MNICDIYEIAGIKELPVNPEKAASALGIKTVSYNSMCEVYEIQMRDLYEKSPCGFAFREDNRFVIAINENSCGERRRRFTAAHELGHCVLGHVQSLGERSALSDFEERQADKFAANFLAPLAVLILCTAESPDEIKKLCGISGQAAEIRFKELVKLKRSLFLLSPESRKLTSLFSDFIERYRDGKYS